jgi:hypothetical protein
MPDNRQPQAGAAGVAGARFLDAIETLEHAREIVLGDPGAVVRD